MTLQYQDDLLDLQKSSNGSKFPSSIYVSKWGIFLTLLEYTECGRSQRLNETPDVRHVLILCSKYVNYLNHRQQKS